MDPGILGGILNGSEVTTEADGHVLRGVEIGFPEQVVGVAIVGVDDVEIGQAGLGNTITDNLNDGIRISSGATRTIVNDNIIYNNLRYGVHNTDSNGTTILDNEFELAGVGNGSTAIY